MTITFGDFELDTAGFVLRCGGEPVPMEPQVFDVMAYLVAHRDRVVPKEELLDEVWGDRFVSESALTSRIKAVRRALGDDGRRQEVIRTVHGRGYQFVAPVGGGVTAPTAGVATRHNLPTERTPLFGRVDDVSVVGELVGSHRLVTLTGMGGAGKTRLATAVAHAVLDRFPDGVWFVDLVPADDRRAVVSAIAHSAGLGAGGEPTGDEVVAPLAGRRALFLLDNCEHVGDAVAATLDVLLERTEGPHFLATSREPLGLPDERRHVVAPLDAGDDAAVALFEAAAARVGVEVPATERGAVERICRRLDGLPLALELAAAQLRLLGPAELAARLDDRLDLLERATAPAVDRHGSLRAVLEDTWGLLSEDERHLTGLLAAFPGPFTVTDAEGLAAASATDGFLARLGRLVDCSLVVRDGDGRLRLLETVRLFARERGDAELSATRHAEWCLGEVATYRDRLLFDFGLASWCVPHFDDLRAAETCLLAAGRVDEAALLTAATGLSMHFDPGARAAEVLGRVDEHLDRVDDPALRARLHLAAGLSAMAVRAPESIARHGQAAIAEARRAGDARLLSVGLVLGSWSTVFEDPPAALRMVDEAAHLAEDVGDELALDWAVVYRAFHLGVLRRYEEALAAAEMVIDRALGAGRENDLAVGSAIVAAAALRAVDDPSGARRWASYLLGMPTPEHAMWGNQVVVAVAEASAGDATAAAILTDEIRRRLQRAGIDGLPDLLLPAAALAHQRGDDERAARWLRAVHDAARPTQSFQATILYRRLRDAVGDGGGAGAGAAPLEELASEAFDWLAASAAP